MRIETQNLRSFPEGQKPHPWRRYFAKSLDLGLVIVLVAAMLFFLGFFDELANIKTEEEMRVALEDAIEKRAVWKSMLYASLMYCILIFLEAALIAKTGFTPGKWLFGIKVLRKSGGNLSFPESFKRSVLVWIWGMWLNLYLLMALLANAFAYARLMRSHSTMWDDAVGSVVVAEEDWNGFKVLCAICTLVVVNFGALSMTTILVFL